MEASHEEVLSILGETFEGRIKPRPTREGEQDEGPLALALPMNVAEVKLLAEVATRYSVALVAVGAGTATDLETGAGEESVPSDAKGSILVRFDLMRRTQLPDDPEETWAEAEPGALWLELDNDLHARGRGLAVYPTSAPRATIGGWLAMDGLGVGSFEYGWLHENVISAEVVLPGGELRKVKGEDLRSFIGLGESSGIFVSVRLRTRRADADVPFCVAFGEAESLIGAVEEAVEGGEPFWHLAFLNPEMARARSLGEGHLLFGAYPRGRTSEVEEGLKRAIEAYHGRVLPAAEAYRVWGERFFPVAPSHPIPRVTRELISVAKLPQTLDGIEDRPERVAVQGTVARSGEVLLLTFNAQARN